MVRLSGDGYSLRDGPPWRGPSLRLFVAGSVELSSREVEELRDALDDWLVERGSVIGVGSSE